MENLGNSNKVVLRDDTIGPFTMERAGDKIIFQEYIKVMRLGCISAKWLLDCFELMLGTGYAPKQELSHHGKIVLTVLNESGYIYIIGTNVRFNMSKEVAVKLTENLKRLLTQLDV